MITNDKGLEIIRSFEGCRLNAYPDPGTGSYPWTIGYGHAGPDVHRGKTITQEQADDLLKRDLLRFERDVESLIKDSPTSENQFSAMVSLAFNIGSGNFRKSSVLKNHLAKRYNTAAASFILWNKASGRVIGGLTRRRLAEAKLYAS